MHINSRLVVRDLSANLGTQEPSPSAVEAQKIQARESIEDAIMENHSSGMDVSNKLNEPERIQQHRPGPSYGQSKSERLALEAASVARAKANFRQKSPSLGSSNTPTTAPLMSDPSRHSTHSSPELPSKPIIGSMIYEGGRISSESSRPSPRLTEHVLRVHTTGFSTDQAFIVQGRVSSSSPAKSPLNRHGQAGSHLNAGSLAKSCTGAETARIRAAMTPRDAEQRVTKLILY